MKINHVKVRDWKIRIRPYEWIIWAILLIVVAVVVNNNVRLNLKNYHTDFAVLSAFFLLLFAYKFVSAMKKTLKGYKHEAITRDNYPIVYGLIRNIEIRTGTKVLPKAYVIEHKESRAMALSYGIFSFNAILFSKKFLQEATQDELECIIAHEIGHIRCREALIVIFQLLITVLLFQYLFFLKIDQISEITRENFSWRLLLTQLFYSFYVFILA
jgi:Zn-dependent protease with chaperone function